MNIFGRRSRDSDRDRTGQADAQAIDRYRYMLSTAPPEDIERAHEEAFAALTPEQRREVLRQLADHVPPSELRGDDPASLARTATRAEMRQPGTMERAFGGGGGGFASSFLPILAGSFIGTAIASQFFANDSGYGDGGGEGGDGSTDAGSDTGDAGGGGDVGGGDFGGGDFGGGDFGGGDFGGF
jgi:hypothetical protein